MLFALPIKAQNFVYNGNFEILKDKLPSGFAHWHRCDGIYNLNGHHFLPYGTPDFFHYKQFVDTTGSFNSMAVPWKWWLPNLGFATVHPQQDSAMMGFVTYIDSVADYREYIQVPLKYPLVPGTEYEISLWLTNGFSNLGYLHSTDRLGVLFSKDSLHQNFTHPLNRTAHAEIQGVVWDTTWKQHHISFVADSAYQFMSVGNFYPDSLTNVIVQGPNGQLDVAYYFIDGIEAYPKNVITLQGPSLVEICQGDSVLLESYNDTVFQWAEATNPNVIISTHNSLWVKPTVNSQYLVYGSSDTISIQVNIYNKPIVKMGPDTIICKGSLYYLEPQKDSITTLLWDDATTAKGKWITASGIHKVEATRFGCAQTFERRFEFVECAYSICKGDSIKLEAFSDSALGWALTSSPQNILTTQSSVWVKPKVSSSYNLYSSFDTITVYVEVFDRPLVLDLKDVALCQGEQLLVNTIVDSAVSYYWSTGDTTSSIWIDSAGYFSATIWNANCHTSVSFNAYTLPCSYVFCEGENAWLTGYSSQGLWALGSFPDSIIYAGQSLNFVAQDSTVYFLYTELDTHLIQVDVIPSLIVDLGNDTVVCEGEEFWIDLDINDATYFWNNQYEAESFLVSEPGVIWVDVTLNGCAAHDSILVEWEDCSARLEMPNVFTPNSDGDNDFFRPLNVENVVNFELLVFNRWGDLLYQGGSLEGWNGEYNMKPSADGVYFWIVNYSGLDQKNKQIKGDVTLVR